MHSMHIEENEKGDIDIKINEKENDKENDDKLKNGINVHTNNIHSTTDDLKPKLKKLDKQHCDGPLNIKKKER